MTGIKNINGSVTVSDIVDGYRVQQTYFGYTVTQAKKRLRSIIKAGYSSIYRKY